MPISNQGTGTLYSLVLKFYFKNYRVQPKIRKPFPLNKFQLLVIKEGCLKIFIKEKQGTLLTRKLMKVIRSSF
jgi:hypothetical protein